MDPHDLDRFVAAQRDSYATALSEIRRGAKRSHWTWFVFPQMAGLGHSDMARCYGIASLDEARAYLRHPVLGDRLRACVGALQALPPTTAQTVFGNVDAAKLRSSLTLFDIAGKEPIFRAALDRWFDGNEDEKNDRADRAETFRWRRSRSNTVVTFSASMTTLLWNVLFVHFVVKPRVSRGYTRCRTVIPFQC